MSAALHVKLFNQFKEITDAARNMVSRHIQPLLNGARLSGEHDKSLADLYEEWQAGCRAAAAGLQRTLYPNEYQPMPAMPVDDEEHQPCRQMAAVLIERTIYGEQVAQRWFYTAAENIKNNPACANHPKTCACKMALEGWTYADNLETVKQLQSFYEAHYEEEKDEAYLAVARAVANMRGTTLEYELQRQRKQKADLEHYEAREAAEKKAKAERRKGWAFICYQDCGPEIEKYNDGKCMHGFYRVVKAADCYEFTLMETDLWHPDWQEAARDHEVWRFPLDMPMGVKDTAFENVTPDKIHMA
jgi:hypothetical protein